GGEIWQRISEVGLAAAGGIVDEILEREVGKITMESTEEDITHELQTRMSLAAVLEQQRSKATTEAVREQFEDGLRAVTEAGQDSKELRSAKQHLLSDRIVDSSWLPFPVGPAPDEGEQPTKDSTTKAYVKKAAESLYKELVRRKIAIEKRRPDGRSEEQIRP